MWANDANYKGYLGAEASGDISLKLLARYTKELLSKELSWTESSNSDSSMSSSGLTLYPSFDSSSGSTSVLAYF